MDKISQASRWHISRARQIRKSHPELIAQYQHKRSKTYFFLISFLCSLQVVIASFCQYVPLYVVFLLSATVGACCVLVVFFSILVALAGWYAFVYLLLSFLFIKGLLFHPYILFWLTEHKTTQHEDFCQPTTSVYHWVTDVLFWHLNYHVEHHDFPAIAGKYLPLIREACHEQYEPLFHFKSLPDAYQQFFQADEAWTCGCQQVTPAAATTSQETQHTG